MTIQEHIKALNSLERLNAERLHITAYENQLSLTAASFLGSKLSERYYFGAGEEGIINWDPFTCIGMEAVQDVIKDAERAAAAMMNAEVVNLRCLSGAHAMMCAILVSTNPGDTVMILQHDDGGHFSTLPILERTGRQAAYATFDLANLDLDLAQTAKTFRDSKCAAIYIDISYPLKTFNLRGLRKALGDDAIIIYDASHTIGLMMGGVFQSPLAEGANIVCANTHKTLPGPQKGMILFRDKDAGQRMSQVIDAGLFSSSHTHHLVALAIAILEMEAFGREYAAAIVRNSHALGVALEKLGHSVRKISPSRYTQTHQVHLFLPPESLPIELYKRLVQNNISTNFDDRLGGQTFARLGTQELTRRGMTEADMETIAKYLNDALAGHNVASQVSDFSRKFKQIKYSFDS